MTDNTPDPLAAVLAADPVLGVADPTLWSGRTTKEQGFRELAERLRRAGVTLDATRPSGDEAPKRARREGPCIICNLPHSTMNHGRE